MIRRWRCLFGLRHRWGSPIANQTAGTWRQWRFCTRRGCAAIQVRTGRL